MMEVDRAYLFIQEGKHRNRLTINKEESRTTEDRHKKRKENEK